MAGFERSINKLERIRTQIEVFPDTQMKDVVRDMGIDLGIIAVPAENAQEVTDKLTGAGVKGILNFAPIKIEVPDGVMYSDMDFTNALRMIAAQLKEDRI